MKKLVSLIERISKLGAIIAALILVGMVSFILFEIVLRTFFDKSTFIMDEMVGYGVAAATFLALPYALGQQAVIRVELLLGQMQGGKRCALEVFSCLSAMAATAVLIWFVWIRVARAWTRNSVSSSIAEVPMWIPQGLILLGLCLLMLQVLAILLKQFYEETEDSAA